MLYGSVCRALIWWEPLCMTSKDTVMPQNLKADVSVLCQNIQGKVCFTLMKTSINRPWHLISIYVWGGGEHRKCHIVMYEHSLLWVEFFFLSFFFVLLLQCDKLPSPHFLQAPMRGWIYLLLFDICQMEYNTAQKQYFTLCLGADESESQMNQAGWSHFCMHLQCGNFEKANSEIVMRFSLTLYLTT